MRFDILTLFPAIFEGPFSESIIKRGQEKGSIFIQIHDIRQETKDKHRTADDSPFGGGCGMVMLAEPVINLLAKLRTEDSKTILLTPAGKKLTQQKVMDLSEGKHLIIICGHYEGIDERIRGKVDEEISIGDYVLTGGELPAAVLVDSVSRFIPGVVKEMDSVRDDSFSDGLLEYPHYTRPSDLSGMPVPDVLLSGNHEDIRKWRRKSSLKRTLLQRPDLLAEARITEEDSAFLKEIIIDGGI